MKSRKVHAISAELLGNMEALGAAMLLRGHLVNANKVWGVSIPWSCKRTASVSRFMSNKDSSTVIQ
jgi:hypothetical protein